MCKKQILIFEPNTIIYKGIETIINDAFGTDIDIIELTDFDIISVEIAKYTPSMLLLDASIVTPKDIQAFKKKYNIKLIAIQTALLVNPMFLSDYDEIIYIFDSNDTIKNKIAKIIDSNEYEEEQETLSAREKEILIEVVKGLTNKEIADKLNLSIHTVISHRKKVSTKLQIHSTAGLTIYAISNNLISMDNI